MVHLAPLIYDLALMLGLASLVIVLFQRIKQPVVLGYLVAGMIIGPYTPPYALVKDLANIQTLSELGVIFLMFSLGLEFSFHKLTRIGLTATIAGVFEVILMMVIGYSIGRLLHWSYYDSIFLGAALSISSTTIIIKALDELNLKREAFAEIVFGVLIIEDLVAILLLVGLSTLVVTQNVLSNEMVYAAIQLILVVGGWFLIGYFLMPPLFKRIGNYINQETLTIISVALCLILVTIAAKFHYSTALGAFIMGSILAETHLVNRIEINVQPIRDIFAAVFFITVGMLIDPKVIVEHWFAVIVVTVITILGKIIVTSLGVLLTGKPVSVASRVGFSMAQIGEFSFIIVALGASLKVISSQLYPIVVAVSALTTFTTPYLIRLSGHFSTGIENRLPKRTVNWLERYAKWIYQTTKPSDNQFFLAVLSRILINAILVAIIFKLAHYLLLARIITHFNPKWLWSAVCLWISFVLASPFIWGMLFSFKASKPQYVWQLRIGVSCIWLVTVAELGLLSWVYFYSWHTIAMVVGFAVLFFGIFHRYIARYYQWFEKQMIENVKKDIHKK